MLRAINRVNTGWQPCVFIWSRSYYLNSELSVIKFLEIHLYNRPRVADRRRLMLRMVPVCLGTKSPRSWSKC